MLVTRGSALCPPTLPIAVFPRPHVRKQPCGIPGTPDFFARGSSLLLPRQIGAHARPIGSRRSDGRIVSSARLCVPRLRGGRRPLGLFAYLAYLAYFAVEDQKGSVGQAPPYHLPGIGEIPPIRMCPGDHDHPRRAPPWRDQTHPVLGYFFRLSCRNGT